MKKIAYIIVPMAVLILLPAAAAPTAGGLLSQRRRQTPVAAAPAADPAASSQSEARSSAIPEDAEEKTSDIYIPAGTDLEIAFKIYGQLIGKTVLRDPAVPDAKITLVSLPGQKLSKEEQIEALDAVFEMNNIHIEPYGTGSEDEQRFVRAVPRDKNRPEGAPTVVTDEEAEIPNTMKLFSVMIPFRNIPIDEAKTVLEGLKSSKGLLLAYERIGKILVTDTGLNINSMRRVAHAVDVATPVNENVFVRQIENASATDIKTAIEQIVQESQKELEKASKAQQTAQQPGRPLGMSPQPTLLRRPGAPNNPQPPAATSPESLVTNVSDADRGLIRGKVLITADERSNKLIIITSQANMNFFDNLIKELDVTTTPEVEVKVVRLKYADAEDVSDMINDLIGNSSAAKNNGKGNTNMNARNGSGGNLTRNTPQPATPQRAAANQRSGESKAGELSKDNVTVLADKRINGLVVMAHKDVWPTVESIINSMDVKLAQVLIETAIVEVTLGDELKTGIDWVQRGRQRVDKKEQATNSQGLPLYWHESIDDEGNTIYEQLPEVSDNPVMRTVTTLARDTFVNNGSYGLGGGGGSGASMLNTMMNVGTNATSAFFGGANPIGSGVNYLLKSDKLNIAAVIQASKDDSRSKYVASPIVMTVDNKEATIEATQMRYLLKGYTYSGSTYNGTTVPDYEQKEIGLTIKVTPKINPNGTVMLKVEEEYSQVGANQSIQANVGGTATSSVSVPTTITRKMSADISLDNMQTVVLGGLTETSESESETGIPILKDIPWIGKWLFSSTTKEENRKELLVFMTPYVLDDATAAQEEARRRKDSLSDSRAWMNGGGWSASELADPVSQKETLRRLKDIAAKRDEDRSNRLAIEKWKLDRAKELEKMSAVERKFWLEQHRDEIVGDAAKEAFDEEVKAYEQEDLKNLAKKIREEKLGKAEETIEADTKTGETPKKEGE